MLVKSEKQDIQIESSSSLEFVNGFLKFMRKI